MTRTIIINGTEFPAFEWTEATPVLGEDQTNTPRHVRDEHLLEEGISDIGTGEVYFHCDQTFAFDTTFSMKGDGRKYVIIGSEEGRHVAKPY
jgi:hypothetical protein